MDAKERSERIRKSNYEIERRVNELIEQRLQEAIQQLFDIETPINAIPGFAIQTTPVSYWFTEEKLEGAVKAVLIIEK